MLPRVIAHNAVSLDGRFGGFEADLRQYYQIIGCWKESATLVGSQTILSAPDQIPEETIDDLERSVNNPEDTRPLLVVVDSRGRVKTWHYLLKTPYWKAGVALCSQLTPRDHLKYLSERNIDHIVAGYDHVDLRAALEELTSRYKVETVRVDSGSILNGVLLRSGLTDEVSLLIHPVLVGGNIHRPFFNALEVETSDNIVCLRLIHLEQLENGLVWVRYEVPK
jgi:2,5-diamino-6-(ribosylamino)-4(3H)-pyrimidinone 5'-phosphate reductase